jgi:hypothetical protein
MHVDSNFWQIESDFWLMIFIKISHKLQQIFDKFNFQSTLEFQIVDEFWLIF